MPDHLRRCLVQPTTSDPAIAHPSSSPPPQPQTQPSQSLDTSSELQAQALINDVRREEIAQVSSSLMLAGINPRGVQSLDANPVLIQINELERSIGGIALYNSQLMDVNNRVSLSLNHSQSAMTECILTVLHHFARNTSY